MTDLDHGQTQPQFPTDHSAVSTDQLTKASLLPSGGDTSPGGNTGLSDSIHTVETEEASITFVGGVRLSGDFSESESDEDPDNVGTAPKIKSVGLKQEGFNVQSAAGNLHVKPGVDGLSKHVSTGNFTSATTQSKQVVNGDISQSPYKSQVAVLNTYNQSDPEHVENGTRSSDFTINPVEGEDSPSTNGILSKDIEETGDKTHTDTDTLVKAGSPLLSDRDDRPRNHRAPDWTDSVVHSRPARFNPFDRDVVFEEDYFATPEHSSSIEAYRDYTDNLSPGSRHGRQPQSFSSASDSFSFCSPDFQDEEFSFADLGLAEDHFSRPEGHFGMSTLEELEMAMENCKEMIKDAPQHSDKQKTLVRKLVHLRMKYQEYKLSKLGISNLDLDIRPLTEPRGPSGFNNFQEGPEPVEEDVKLVVGHKFKQKDSRSSKHYCEKCNAVIWGMLQVWYRCTECGYHCHDKCLNQITRTCASVRVAENPSYILAICPEKGLAYQNYRCAECRAQISFKSGFSEPRLCDYSGNYYCELCHWNDVMIIPARVLHNWDFSQYKVCRAAKQYLRLMTNKAVLRIQDINPMLFNFVEELDDVKKLREEILIMKKYFLSCKSALESKLLLQLSSRQHCVENSDMYSLKDLVDVQSDLLLPELAKVHSSFAQHIKSDCQLCQAKGFICELCDIHEVLFPFDNIAVVCAQCSYVLHRHCFVKKDNMCPRCERRNKRNGNSLEPS